MIQEAAAKCRFCGEWLDPTKRPEWASAQAAQTPAAPAPTPAAAAPQPAVEAAPMGVSSPVVTPSAAAVHRDPAATTTDGSTQAPRRGPRSATQTWAAPAWMAPDKRPPGVGPSVTATPVGSSVATPTAAPTPSQPPEGASLEEVAERMQRIKASAMAVRHAVEAEIAEPAPAVLPADEPEDPAEAAVTMHAGALVGSTAPVADPAPDPAPVHGLLGDDDFGDDDFGDDDFGDDDFGDTEADDNRVEGASGKTGDSAFGGDFDFGDDFDDDDAEDDGDFGDFGDMGASRPVPWKPVAIGAAVVLSVGIAAFWGRIFPSETAVETDPTAEEQAADGAEKPAGNQVAQGSVVPPPAAAVPGQGQPVVPEPAVAVGTPPGDPAAAPADPAAAPVDPAAVPVDPAAAPVDPAAAVPAAAAAPLDPAALEQLEEARKLYRGGGKKRLKQAKEILDGIVGGQPNNPDALVVLAQVELELGNPAAALETATKCTQVSAQTADCWLTIGVLKQDGKESTEAAEAYERYLALAPDGAYAGQVRKQLKRLN